MTFFAVLAIAVAAAWVLPPKLGGRSVKTAARHAMGAAFIVAGLTHLLMPETLLAYFPSWVPYPEVINIVSGLVEIVGGLALFVPRFQVPVGRALAVYLVLVFPANVYVAVAGVRVPGLPDVWWYPWVRLPFQAIFIWWVLRSTAPSKPTEVDRALVTPNMQPARAS